ncbi:hypothetical protein VP758_005188 [Vibrio harveyi]|nr:hypothetical protein [Vibrio harveyi]
MIHKIETKTGNIGIAGSNTLEKVTPRAASSSSSIISEKTLKVNTLNSASTFSNTARRSLPDVSIANSNFSHLECTIYSLNSAISIIEQLKTNCRKALQVPESQKKTFLQLTKQSHIQLVNLQKNANFKDNALLNEDLSVVSNSDWLDFYFKGVNIKTARDHDEVISFQFEDGKPAAVRAKVKIEHTQQDIAKVMSDALSPRGIKVKVNSYGDLAFSVLRSKWSELKNGIWVSGGGQSLPSGNPIKVKSIPINNNFVDITALNFNNTDEIRKSIPKLDLLLSNSKSLIMKINSEKINIPEHVSKNNWDTSGFVKNGIHVVDNSVSILIAQANANRDNVVELLS